jgi:type I restriction enzyme S subunit
MIGDLKPYSAYKDSGVPWLEKVPEHWEIVPLASIARPRKVTNEGDRELLSVYLGRGVIPFTSVEEKRTNTTSEDLSKYQLVEPGDFVLNNQQAWRGSVGVSRYTGIVSPAYLVLALDKRLNREFADKLFSDRAMVTQYLVCSKGVGSIQRNLYWPHLKRVVTVIPPSVEQTQIATFLDYADRRIRRYIRSKQKLIKLLEEQKQVIINQAVTRGLDPNVLLKPSGIEWLGDIPEHWEAMRLKRLVERIDQGVSPQAENYLAESGRWGVLKAGCVNRGVFKDIQHKRLPIQFSIDPKLVVNLGDVLVSRASGSPKLVGSVGRVHELNYQLILSDKIFRPVFRAGLDPEFMILAMNSRYYRMQVEKAISGAEGLANNLPSSSLRTFIFAIPPKHEQKMIVRCIQEETNSLIKTIQRTEKEVSLLHEFRTRLIADVVTGKLDVREAAARLPVEVDDPEPLDDDLPEEDLGLDDDSEPDAAPEDEAA